MHKAYYLSNQEEKKEGGMTALAGLPAYLDLAHMVGLRDSITRDERVREGEQGWTDAQVVLSLVLLNLAGGDCVDDLRQCFGIYRGFMTRSKREIGSLTGHIFLAAMSI